MFDMNILNDYQKECMYMGSISLMLESVERIHNTLLDAKKSGYHYDPNLLKTIDSFVEDFNQFREVNRNVIEDYFL